MAGITQPVTGSEQSALSDPKAPAGPPTLRHYQTGSLVAIDRELATLRSTLVVKATGTGKTVTFAERARRNSARGVKTLILVNRDELVRQTHRKCEAVGLYPDVEKAKQRATAFAKVVIASVQSLRGARLTRWARDHFAEIIVDECHHAVAKGYIAIFDHFESAKVVGFTATPDRADGKALGTVFQSTAYRYEIRQAIAEQYLVPIVARRIVVDSIDLRRIDERAGDFAQDQLAEAMAEERTLRGVAEPLLELARDRLTIGFCVDVEHAHKMAAVMNTYRPGCARAVSGETDDIERERMLDEHRRGVFQFLFNCEVLVEGYDCPEVSCVAMLRPTKSRARFVQGAGRGLRPAPWIGKRDCLLLCFTDATSRLIGPADCLAGAGELPDDLREEIDRLITGVQLEIGNVIDQALGDVEKRRVTLRVAAVVRYHTEFIDPFIGPDPSVATRPRNRPEDVVPPTARQLAALEAQGVTLSKIPPQFSMADASHLLTRLAQRSRAGLARYKHAKKLREQTRKFCTLDVENMSADAAKRLYTALRDSGWHFTAIAESPEVLAARGRSREVKLSGGFT